MVEKTTPARGRPKTLDRNHILQTALMQYWSEGPTNVSISDICRLTGASKPGVYREFGSDDGLKKSVLEGYHALAIHPLIELLKIDQPMTQTTCALIGFMMQDRTALGIPQGCLFVMMRAQSQQLGALTSERVEGFRRDLLRAFAAWIDRSKMRGECADIPTDVAALYIDAQHGGAMRMQREGVANETIADVLKTAFGVLALGVRKNAQ